ncbi:uncharacterized protein [Amphiura filiformis]|uniref:uncharacterized protein isoform X2 n=1 Tax=Amphiura filiformis TaxID=82378 RepID=UPI003B22667A
MGGNVSSTNFQPDYKPYRLASPFSDLEHSYDVVVIGSGYGGSIAASRAARAGLKVCLLEKGKEWRPGDFPEKELNAVKELQMTVHNEKKGYGNSTNLYDLIVSPDVAVLQGCGLGGTSLINANVGLDCETRIYDDEVWPQAFRDDLEKFTTLDRDRVYDMLKPTEYPDNHLDMDKLPKMAAMEKAAKHIADIEDLEYDKILRKVPLYVNFKNKEENHVGIPQPACINCGNCCGGCNTGAKNTLNMNYLPDAKAHGAKMFTEVEVKNITRDEKTDSWRVHYVHHGQDAFENRERVVRAQVVILGAGSLGSTNILLQSKNNGLELSTNIGQRFTTNGDALGFSYNGEDKIRPAGKEVPKVRKRRKGPGPCITSVIDMRHRTDKGLGESYVLEDGTPPCSVDVPYKFLLRWVDSGVDTTPGENDWREWGRHLVGKGWKNSLAFLSMSNDDSSGELKLDPKNGRVWVHYPKVGEGDNFQVVKKGMTHATTALKGYFVPNPFWGGLAAKIRDTKGIVTVHPLGGCIMAESGKDGVVNHAGQAYKGDTDELLSGLYVMDGAVMPRCLGVNPSLTIAMVAERCMRLMAEQRGWNIDYASTKKIDLSLSATPNKPGIKFTERMVGKMSVGNKSSDSDFILTIETQDVEKMISEDPSHAANIYGSVSIPALSDSHLTVSNGHFTLFSKSDGKHHTREMTYRMLLTSNEGQTYYFEGVKVVSKDSAFEIGLSDTTTLNVSLYKGEDNKGDVVGTGRLHIRVKDFIKQLSTMVVTNTTSPLQRLKWKTKFGNFFAGCLWEVYGFAGSPDTAFNPNAPPREKRALKLDDVVPKVHKVSTKDDTELLLTRYEGGTKGPVMLVHDLGMSSRIFVVDTIETNLLEYLVSKGYDVWLADWRASILLPSHKEKSTLDDSAKYDIPALVDKILEVTGSPDIQVMGQCGGSLLVFASLLSGQLEGKIRCLIASQVAFFTHPEKSTWKVNVPHLLYGDGLTAYTDTEVGWKGRFVNRLFETAADLSTEFGEHCSNSVCHRVTIMYGRLYEHDNLSKDTHDNLHEQFGFCSVAFLKHMSKCFSKNYLVSADGKNIYLPDHNKKKPLESVDYMERMRYLNLPILFINGEDNRVYDPKGMDQSYERCKEANPEQDYQRKTSPGYGHIDSIIGKDAVLHVFPKLLPFLDKYAEAGSVVKYTPQKKQSIVPELTVKGDMTDSSLAHAYHYGGEDESMHAQNGDSQVGNGHTTTHENGSNNNGHQFSWHKHGRQGGMRDRSPKNSPRNSPRSSPRSSPRASPRTSPSGSPDLGRRESLAPINEPQ